MARTPKKADEKRPDNDDEDEFLKLRRSLATRIPVMLDAAVAAYERIATDVDVTDPKAVSSMHSAAKAALSHIEQVIKVAEWVLDVPQADTSVNSGDAEKLLMFARRSMSVDASISKSDEARSDG